MALNKGPHEEEEPREPNISASRAAISPNSTTESHKTTIVHIAVEEEEEEEKGHIPEEHRSCISWQREEGH